MTRQEARSKGVLQVRRAVRDRRTVQDRSSACEKKTSVAQANIQYHIAELRQHHHNKTLWTMPGQLTPDGRRHDFRLRVALLRQSPSTNQSIGDASTLMSLIASSWSFGNQSDENVVSTGFQPIHSRSSLIDCPPPTPGEEFPADDRRGSCRGGRGDRREAS